MFTAPGSREPRKMPPGVASSSRLKRRASLAARDVGAVWRLAACAALLKSPKLNRRRAVVMMIVEPCVLVVSGQTITWLVFALRPVVTTWVLQSLPPATTTSLTVSAGSSSMSQGLAGRQLRVVGTEGAGDKTVVVV